VAAPALEPWPPPHKTFQKIPRLARQVVITEKLDGTNALVAIHHDPAMPLAIGSRNRWLTPGKTSDNYDFCRWVLDNEETIRRLGPGWHYGEWWGIGIARRYNIGERRWSLFDTRWTEEELRGRGLPANVRVVPTLVSATLSPLDATQDPVQSCINDLFRHGSVAAPGFMHPEGIVIRHSASGHLYKWTFGGDGTAAPKVRGPHDLPSGAQ
jgi:hypothetical protein